jgi:hypothetical protein
MAIPTAQVRPGATAQVFYHWLHNASQVDTHTENLQVYGADAMVTGDFEVGITRLQDVVRVETSDLVTTASIDSVTTFNGRYHLDLAKWTSNPEAPDVAIGVRDISDEVNRALYVVVSKGVHFRQQQGPYDVTFTLGYGHTKDQAGLLDGFFGGVDFSPGSNFRIQAEYDAQEWNACLRFYPCRTLSIDLGSFNSNFGAGLTYESSW